MKLGKYVKKHLSCSGGERTEKWKEFTKNYEAESNHKSNGE